MTEFKTTMPAASALAEIEALAVAAAAVTIESIDAPTGLEGVPTSIPIGIKHGKNPEAVSLASLFESFRTRPARRKGNAQVTTLASFVELTNRHKDADSAIFAQTGWPNPSLTAVVDYHQRANIRTAEGSDTVPTIGATPRFGGHRITYNFPLTDEFKIWMGSNGKPMEQAVFACFLEDHAAELAAPLAAERNEYEPLFKAKFAAPNEIIDLSRSLEIYVGAKVKRAERIQTGERTVEFVEEHTNPRGEKVDIPGIFMLSVPAYIDGDAVRMPARLRYRHAQGEIVWFYHLYRPEFWLRTQVQADLAYAAKATGLPAYEGAPENA